MRPVSQSKPVNKPVPVASKPTIPRESPKPMKTVSKTLQKPIMKSNLKPVQQKSSLVQKSQVPLKSGSGSGMKKVMKSTKPTNLSKPKTNPNLMKQIPSKSGTKPVAKQIPSKSPMRKLGSKLVKKPISKIPQNPSSISKQIQKKPVPTPKKPTGKVYSAKDTIPDELLKSLLNFDIRHEDTPDPCLEPEVPRDNIPSFHDKTLGKPPTPVIT